MPKTASDILLDLEAIKQLKARYCRYLDTKQWDAFLSLFAEDARFDGFASAPSGSDAKTFVKGVSTRLKDAITKHHCHTPDIVFLDDARARAIWAMEDYLEWPVPTGNPDAPNSRGMYGFGHYEEEYRKIDGIWKMAHLRLIRARLIPLPDDHPMAAKPAIFASMEWLKGASV